MLQNLNLNRDSTDSIQSFIDTWRSENKIPAVAVAVQKPHQSTQYFFSGTTTQEGNTKITAANIFGVGSITKTFITATILQLQRSHQLALDDSMN